MVKVNIRWKLAKTLHHLRGESIGTKIKVLWHKGWEEIPVIMFTSILPIIGLSMTAFTSIYGSTHDLTPKYYTHPKIYRPDDPRVKNIKHYSVFDN